jgi:hypothetical protein
MYKQNFGINKINYRNHPNIKPLTLDTPAAVPSGRRLSSAGDPASRLRWPGMIKVRKQAAARMVKIVKRRR